MEIKVQYCHNGCRTHVQKMSTVHGELFMDHFPIPIEEVGPLDPAWIPVKERGTVVLHRYGAVHPAIQRLAKRAFIQHTTQRCAKLAFRRRQKGQASSGSAVH